MLHYQVSLQGDQLLLNAGMRMNVLESRRWHYGQCSRSLGTQLSVTQRQLVTPPGTTPYIDIALLCCAHSIARFAGQLPHALSGSTLVRQLPLAAISIKHVYQVIGISEESWRGFRFGHATAEISVG